MPPRIPARVQLALRLAGLAALVGGGIGLGRGVVGMTNSRSQPVEVAASAPAAAVVPTPQAPASLPAAPAAGSVFTSSLRSWAAAAAPTLESTPVPSVASPETAGVQSANQPAATYAVAAGDTLSQIATRFGTDTAALVEANKLANPNVLAPGTEIVIPPSAPQAASTQTPDGRAVTLATAPPVVGPASPAQAVRTFYQYVNARQFAEAAALWSPRMRGAYPPAQNIDSRFAQTQTLTLSRADVVQVDAASGRATVAVRLSEVVGPAGSTREYAGNWNLVRGSSGWLLDDPNLQPS